MPLPPPEPTLTRQGRSDLQRSLAAVLFALVTSFRLLAAPIDHPAIPTGQPAVSVKDFGAKGDGVTDDRAAVQAAIDSLTTGGTILFPPGTYLMDSYITAKAGDRFNLVTSHDNLSFEPTPGAAPGSVTLIQGPHGWGELPRRRVFGPLAVFNSEFFLASPIGQNGYQNIHQNGGYFTLQGPISAQSQTVTFSTKAEAGMFTVGDWIAVSETTNQEIEPLEINRVVSVDAETGVVGLKWPQTQSYPTGFAAKVSHMVRSNITIRGLTLQGVIPVFLNDLCDFNMIGCKVICDVTYVAPEKGTYIFANGVRQMLFKDNVVSDFPEGRVADVNGVELPQNNSMDVTIEHNTFFMAAGGGEFWAHWVIKDNSFQISPTPSGKHHGLCMQGYDVLFEGNTVTSTANMDYLYTDFSTAPNPYQWIFGAQKIRDNRFSSAGGANVVRLYTPDTEFSGNVIVSGPEQHALAVTISGRPHGNLSRSEVTSTNVLTNNTFHCAVTKAFGCVLLSGPSFGGMTFKDNVLIGHNHSVYGAWIQSDANDETHPIPALNGNHYEGFQTSVFYQAKKAGPP